MSMNSGRLSTGRHDRPKAKRNRSRVEVKAAALLQSLVVLAPVAHSITLSEFCGALLRSLDKAPSFSGKRVRPDLAIFTEKLLLRVMHQRRATRVILPEARISVSTCGAS
jgi:hypothetical protein